MSTRVGSRSPAGSRISRGSRPGSQQPGQALAVPGCWRGSATNTIEGESGWWWTQNYDDDDDKRFGNDYDNDVLGFFW